VVEVEVEINHLLIVEYLEVQEVVGVIQLEQEIHLL
jgi:hypothetical protein